MTLLDQFVIALVVAALIAIAGFGWRSVHAYRKRPIVTVNYWWELVVDTRRLWLSPFVTTSTIRPVGEYQLSKTEAIVHRIARIKSGKATDGEVFQWLTQPHHAYRAGTSMSVVATVSVLRIVIRNQTRRQSIKEEEFGTLRVDIETWPNNAHGWRKGLLGPSVRWPGNSFVNPDAKWGDSSRLVLSLPHALASKGSGSVRETVRDDFTVSGSLGGEGYPSVSVFRTDSPIRIRVKPWKPATRIRPWDVPYHAFRWTFGAKTPPIDA